MRREVRGMFLCCDETLGLPALWDVRPILLRDCSFCDSLVFSTFIFLIIFGLSLKSSCAQPISCRIHRVSFPSMIINALSLSLRMFYFIILTKVPLATRLQFPSCTCCFVYGVLHYGGCFLLHLILLLLPAYR